MPDLLRWAADNWGYLVAAAAVVAVIWRITRAVLPVLRRARDLMDDLLGEPERPGVPARPGVMERLQHHDSVLAELRPNGGHSIKDAVDRIDERTELLGQRLDERQVVPDRPDMS